MELTKRHRYPWVLIEKAVTLSKKENLTYRDISEKINNLGVHVSHKTIYEWVQKFSKDVKIKEWKREEFCFIDVHEVRCNGKNMFMYEARNSKKSTIGLLFRQTKNNRAADRYFLKMIGEINEKRLD